MQHVPTETDLIHTRIIQCYIEEFYIVKVAAAPGTRRTELSFNELVF